MSHRNFSEFIMGLEGQVVKLKERIEWLESRWMFVGLSEKRRADDAALAAHTKQEEG